MTTATSIQKRMGNNLIRVSEYSNIQVPPSKKMRWNVVKNSLQLSAMYAPTAPSNPRVRALPRKSAAGARRRVRSEAGSAAIPPANTSAARRQAVIR